MGQTAIWAFVTALLLGAIIWRIDRYVNRRLQLLAGDEDVSLIERRIAARKAEGTIDATIALRNAELAEQTAAANAAAAHAEELLDDRLGAQRKIIVARTRAEEDLAVEMVRADHAAKRAHETGDMMSLWERYMKSTSGRSDTAKFADFVRIMSASNAA